MEKTRKQRVEKGRAGGAGGRRRPSIQGRIQRAGIILVAATVLLVGGISSWLSYRSTNEMLEQTMVEAARLAAARVEEEIEKYKAVAGEVGQIARLSDPLMTTSQKKALCEERAAAYGLQKVSVLGADGVDLFDGARAGDQEYFKQAMAGRTYVTAPSVDKATGQVAMYVSAPLRSGGTSDGEIVGAVLFVPQKEFLNEIVRTVNISANSAAYIVDAEGNTIAHEDMARVEQGENIEQRAGEYPALAGLAAIHANARKGAQGFGSYSVSGYHQFVAYAPIGVNGWSIMVNASVSDFMKSTTDGILAVLVLMIVVLVVAILVSMRIGRQIGAPVRACAERLEQLAAGDLKSPVPSTSARDETGMLARATADLTGRLGEIVSDMDCLLGEMSQGNLTVKSRAADHYVGNFVGLLESMRKLRDGLRQVLWEVNSAAEQVSGSSEGMAGSAQALGQGAAEQASSVEELTATLAELDQQVKDNAEYTRQVRDATFQGAQALESCNGTMGEMTRAMDEISGKSGEIGKIVKTIEDIAFQTNILALNAAVEAARAGEAGKGFAVVADEVRNLASKSAEAAKNTTALIGETLKAVESGEAVSGTAARALQEVVDANKEATVLIAKIADASMQQAEDLGQVREGMEHISGVVQTNSATAQESAAASEELSAQAKMLETLVKRFRIESDKDA